MIGTTSRRLHGPRSLATEQAFLARLAQLGATLLEPGWRGTDAHYKVLCAKGHENFPRPHYILQGDGICRICARNDPTTAEMAFKSHLMAMGATPIYTKWLGVNHPHVVRCAVGHECKPYPSNVQQGQGICRICAGQDTVAAEIAFRAHLMAIGATTLFDKWLGAGRPHLIRCAAGHECSPRPNKVRLGQGICRVCAQRDPATAERHFLNRLKAMGATPLYEKWMGNQRPHLVRCAAGHECSPRPKGVQQGQGICAVCSPAGFNPGLPGLVYLVSNHHLGAHKLGIGGQNGARVKKWLNHGWKVYQILDFPIGAEAYRVEQSVLGWLRDTLGLKPFLQLGSGDGWTETIDASAIDPQTIWARVEREAWDRFSLG